MSGTPAKGRAAPPPAAAVAAPLSYFRRSRSTLYSFLSVMPLLILYEALILETGSTVRNGADVLVKRLLSVLGVNGMLGFTGLLLLAFCAVVWRDTRKGGDEVDPLTFGLMGAEATLYALTLGPLVAWLTNRLLYANLSAAPAVTLREQLIVSIGAGVYEEFVFRFALVSGLMFVFKRLFDLPAAAAAAFAIFWASLFFSAFHYVGAYAYAFEYSTFLFRFLAGAVLALLYHLRGFGIAVYAHFLYDVFVSLSVIG